MIVPIGTIVNAAAVVIGSLVGIFLRRHLPDNIKTILFDIFGLTTIALAISMILKGENFLTLIFGMLIGGIIGEMFNLQDAIEQLGNIVKRKVKAKDARFTEGLVTTFLLYCIGPLTIVGTINEGLRNDRTLLFTKSMLDGFASIAFAATFGIGVLFTAIPLFIFQSSLTLLAAYAQGLFSQAIINQLTATGGVLILGVGINLLGLKKIKVANLLPALVVVVVLTYFFR